MPTRLIREGILDSENMNALSWGAELFYRRLMSVVDDYGRFSANPTILRSRCYPLQVDKVKDKQISAWLNECVKQGLILHYVVDEKPLLQINKFDQRTRSGPKYPGPDGQLTVKCPANDGLDGDVGGDVGDKKPTKNGKLRDEAVECLKTLNALTGRSYREVDTNLSIISQRLDESGGDKEGVIQMLIHKQKEWGGTEWEKYLRPETLFAKSKFESYYASRNDSNKPKSAANYRSATGEKLERWK